MKAKELIEFLKDKPDAEVLVTLFMVFDDENADCIVALEGELQLTDKAHGNDACMISVVVMMPSGDEIEAD